MTEHTHKQFDTEMEALRSGVLTMGGLVETQLSRAIELLENDDRCEVLARLDAGDRSLVGFGRSRRNPADPTRPQIGEELATARALSDLAHHLSQDAWSMIDRFESTTF